VVRNVDNLAALHVAHPDERLRGAIVEELRPLLHSLCRQFRDACEWDDLLQIAALGLLKALSRYEPTRGRFVSFAIPTIRGELRHHVRDCTWAVRPPRPLLDLWSDVARARAELERRTGRAPHVSEIAEHLKASEERVLEAIVVGRARRSASLDAPAEPGDGAPLLGETLGEEDGRLASAPARAELERALTAVDARTRQVLALRFSHDLTQREIGELVGVSQIQVSRILTRALERLREGIIAVPVERVAGVS